MARAGVGVGWWAGPGRARDWIVGLRSCGCRVDGRLRFIGPSGGADRGLCGVSGVDVGSGLWVGAGDPLVAAVVVVALAVGRLPGRADGVLRHVSRGGMMKQLTQGVRNVMHMAERQVGAEPGGSRPELVGRDAGGRFVGAGGSGSAEAMARMKIGISAAQQRWVETEAARRRLPKTAIVRELLDKALNGETPLGGQESVRDVAPDGVVRDVADLGNAASAGAARAAGGDPGAGIGRGGARVPEVEVVAAEPVHGGCGHAGVHGRHPYYRDSAPATARCSAASGRGAVLGSVASARGRGVGGGRVGAEGGGRPVGGGEFRAHVAPGARRGRLAAAGPGVAARPRFASLTARRCVFRRMLNTDSERS